MKNNNVQCALCGQPVKVEGFELLEPDSGRLQFCCEGCLSVYKLLHTINDKEQQKSD